MFVTKIEYLSSGNTLLSGTDANGNEVVIKAFFPDSGVEMVDTENVKISRQNGSDFYTFPWNKVKSLIGKSGALTAPTSMQGLYKTLFEDFFIENSLLKDVILPNDSDLSTDSKAISTRPNLFFDEVLDGKRTGISVFNKFGQNLSLDTTQQVIASFAGSYAPMETATTLDVVSTSTNDNNALRVGAKSILLTGIDENRLPQTETILLNGDNAVATTKIWLGINKANVTAAGDSLVNEGDINISPTGSSDLQAQIPAGTGTTKQLIFHVPINTVAKIYNYTFNAVKSGSGSTKVTIKGYQLKDGLVQEFFDAPLATNANPILQEKQEIPLKIEGGTSYWFEALTDNGVGRISGRLQQTLTEV